MKSGAAGGVATAIAGKTVRGRRLQSMAWQGLIALAVLFSILLLGIVLVVNTYGKRLMEGESRTRVEEIGNKVVEELERRTHEVGALTRAVATAAESLPRDPAALAAALTRLIDDRGNPLIAGGGYWPEAGFLSAATVPADGGPHEFAWRRDASGILQPAPPAGDGPAAISRLRDLPPGSVSWSAPYRSPETGEPMATLAVGSFAEGRFLGAATIDFRLAELGRLVEQRQKEAGGYGFLLDRNDRFLSFPQSDLVGDEVTAGELAGKRPGFGPIAVAVAGGAAGRPASHLLSTAEVPLDFVTGEASVAFVFAVPQADLKLVLVSPRSHLERTATQILRSLLLLIAGILLAVLLPTYLFMSRTWIRPVMSLAEAAGMVSEGDLNLQVIAPGRDEISALADSFNAMVGRLRENIQRLELTRGELERSVAMTDTILSTVREGLFLLNPELRIEPKHSTALAEIVRQEHLAGVDFVDLLRSLLPEKTHELAVRFLRLLFNPGKTDSVIAKINPLQEVESAFSDGSGQLTHKVLSFTFDRVRQGNQIVQALVTVSDVTARVVLARQLKESQERMAHQAELLLSVMHVEPQALREFIENAHGDLERINDLLREGKTDALTGAERAEFYRGLVERIYRGVHAIKGTAAMLRLDYFTAAAHRFEDALSPLRGRPTLDGNDFVPIVLELSAMVDGLLEVREAIGRFAEMQRGMAAPAVKKDREAVEDLLQRFVSDLSARLGKQAALEVRASADLEIPPALKTPLQTVLAQLVRNAMTHGIEPPAERVAAGKPAKGNIEVAMRQENGHFEVLLRDDGRGLDYERLSARVGELLKTTPGLYDRLVDRDKNQWRMAALDEMVFYPGLSTAEDVSQEAGRGYGMSVVRETLRELGGEINLRQRPGQFYELRIVLPTAEPRGDIA